MRYGLYGFKPYYKWITLNTEEFNIIKLITDKFKTLVYIVYIYLNLFIYG